MGKVIRKERLARGLSQESLADLSSLSRNYIGSIERGESSPSLISLEKIAEALGFTITSLVKLYERS